MDFDFGKMPEWLPIVGGALYVGLEYAIGKSTKIKANSVLEAILGGIGAFYKILASKKPPQV